MKILVTGATGFIGRKLIKELFSQGYSQINVLTRSPLQGRKNIPENVTFFHWNPLAGILDMEAFKDVETVIHLAGERILGLRWTSAKKSKILHSRVNSTKLLLQTINNNETQVKNFISASAVGFYGNRLDENLDEESPPGSGFLSEVCQKWENALFQNKRTSLHGIAVRFGLVLSRDGGPLKIMIPPFSIGLGGVLGSGKQYMSWIHIDDLVNQIIYILENKLEEGVYNGVSPEPVTNRVFTTTLNALSGKRNFFPVPEFFLKTVLGEMSELLLSSQKVTPSKFLNAGFPFMYPTLESALQAEIVGLKSTEQNGEQ